MEFAHLHAGVHVRFAQLHGGDIWYFHDGTRTCGVYSSSGYHMWDLLIFMVGYMEFARKVPVWFLIFLVWYLWGLLIFYLMLSTRRMLTI